jgi:copper ion binding protein
MTTSTPTTSRPYRVVGMTCGHCVAAVQREVGAIAGVTDVAVDLPTGDVVVTSTHPIDHDAMTAAIDEAGYELAS